MGSSGYKHLKLILISVLCCFVYIIIYDGAIASTSKIKESVHMLEKWRERLKNVFPQIASPEEILSPDIGSCFNETDFYLSSSNISNITLNLHVPILTLFTSFVTKPEKYNCYNLTLHNWSSLKPQVVPVLFTNERSLRQQAILTGWTVLPIRVTGTKDKIPVLKYMYMDAMKVSNTTYYAFANGDMLFTDNLISTLLAIYYSGQFDYSIPILLVGQRINVYNITKEEARSKDNIIDTVKERGTLFTPWAEDYFITTKRYPWSSVPSVVIGRVAYDNWLVWYTRFLGHPTIDATPTLLAVHHTTNAGNSEGRGHRESDFNSNMLSRLYRSLIYEAGVTTCADYVTKYDVDCKIQIFKRKKSKNCIM